MPSVSDCGLQSFQIRQGHQPTPIKHGSNEPTLAGAPPLCFLCLPLRYTVPGTHCVQPSERQLSRHCGLFTCRCVTERWLISPFVASSKLRQCDPSPPHASTPPSRMLHRRPRSCGASTQPLPPTSMPWAWSCGSCSPGSCPGVTNRAAAHGWCARVPEPQLKGRVPAGLPRPVPSASAPRVVVLHPTSRPTRHQLAQHNQSTSPYRQLQPCCSPFNCSWWGG